MRKVFYKIFRESVIKSSFGSCGKNVHIAEKSDIKGIGNISIGDDVAIGPHALLWTTRANIIIKEKVVIGPRLSIITGDHKMNAVGKYMADVTDEEKDDYVRTISQTNIIRDSQDINKITLSFVGTGFLRYMVRNIVGTLIAVGEGKIKSEEVIDILRKEDRKAAGKTANPEGLYLKNVFY